MRDHQSVGIREMLRIFVVDDEILAVDYLRTIIEECKTECTLLGFSTNSVMALSSVRRMKPDIAIIDINMPGMSGIEIASELLKTERNLKIIFLTSYRDFEYVKKGMELGVAAYILKNELSPESLDLELKKVVDKLEEEHRLRLKYINVSMRNYLLGMDASFEQAAESEWGGSITKKEYRMLYMVRKRSFGLQNATEEPGFINVEKLISRQEADSVRPCCAANMKNNTWCILYHISCFSDGKESRIIESTWSYFKECGIETIILETPGPVSLQELPSLYGRMSVIDERRLLFGEEKYVSLEDLKGLNRGNADYDLQMQLISETIIRQDRKRIYIVYRDLLASLKETADDEYIKYGQQAFYEYFNYMLNRHYYDELPEEWKCLTFCSHAAYADWLMRTISGFYTKQEQDIREGYSDKVAKILNYIKQNYDDADLSNVQIADDLDISERYMRRLFKDELGITITDYLNIYRVDKAKELLEHENEMVSKIHLRVGFSSSQYFSTVFRRIVGMSPREYKLKVRDQVHST